jgi:hypothetical protein
MPDPVVDLFPPAAPLDVASGADLGNALTQAIAASEQRQGLTPGSFGVPMTIVDITDSSNPFPVAGYRDNEEDYIASEAKVGVMYAAHALLDMVQRFAAATGPASESELFTNLRSEMNPFILQAVPALLAAPGITDKHRLPAYESAFTLSGGTVDFRASFTASLEGMIVPSNNADAAQCVHAVGYSYLNGALASGGFFDTLAQQGVWVAGDFMGGTQYPSARLVTSDNDGPSAQCSTTLHIAHLMTAIVSSCVFNPGLCSSMEGLLSRAAAGPDQPWITRPVPAIVSPAVVTHNKLGLGPLKAGGNVWSEVSILSGLAAADRRYTIAWQNLTTAPSGFAEIATIVKDTITAYEP